MLALILPVGAEWYALNMASVREVVAGPLATLVPTAPATLIGLFNLRGEIVPLFDTAALLGLGSAVAPVAEPEAQHRAPFAAVVRHDLGVAALATTGGPEAAQLGAPVSSDVDFGVACFMVAGASGGPSRLVTLLEVDDLLDPARVGRGWGP